jgi:hypothetical protein
MSVNVAASGHIRKRRGFDRGGPACFVMFLPSEEMVII